MIALFLSAKYFLQYLTSLDQTKINVGKPEIKTIRLVWVGTQVNISNIVLVYCKAKYSGQY